jgi:sodium pump decarboxylase gamma subunit
MHLILPLTENVGTAVNDIAAVPEDTVGKLLYGLNIALIGMGTVFAVLLILMAVLYLFKLFFASKSGSKKPAAPSAPVKTAPVSAPSAVSDSEDELVPVVLAAAVAAYMENSAPHSKYRIRSFKRI